ncbi:MAG: chemotaxis protein CheC [Rhodospirillaceae bacterium]|nr:chemotaxis protein CheC [Rhodospirillaceae bacterium]
MELSKIQQDGLVEILNIAIGRAASSLSQMVKEEISLTIPNASFVEHSAILSLFNKRDIDAIDAVSQKFSGIFSGDAMLIFPESDSLKLVQCVIGDIVDEDSMTELEQETVTEVGNVVLNACLSSFSDQLGLEINGAMPQFLSGKTADVLDSFDDNKGSQITMLVEVSFDISHKEIRGYLVLIIELPSANDMISRIDKFINSVSEK